ncbi:MAG: hypothetical protein HN904_08405 [Victivallales bacterium]|jgi:hypothetical protein|nr:hypothetical protein [Victivallales bacterium]MBT7162785.1 hypothetical protein [Victivallales bacterium]
MGTVRAMIAFLGQYAIAYNATMALHEIGHAVGVTLSGGKVSHISLNPFSWCWTGYSANPQPMVAGWSGVVAGVLFALAPCVCMALFGRKPPRVLLLLGIIGLAANGSYLLGGALARVGDGEYLMRLGVPRLLLVVVGVLLMFAAAAWFLLMQPRFGIPHSASFAQRCGLLLGGIGSYLLLTVVYVVVFKRRDLPPIACFAGIGAVLIICASILATLLGTFLAEHGADGVADVPSWSYASAYAAVGLVVVLAELAAFGR